MDTSWTMEQPLDTCLTNKMFHDSMIHVQHLHIMEPWRNMILDNYIIKSEAKQHSDFGVWMVVLFQCFLLCFQFRSILQASLGH